MRGGDAVLLDDGAGGRRLIFLRDANSGEEVPMTKVSVSLCLPMTKVSVSLCLCVRVI